MNVLPVFGGGIGGGLSWVGAWGGFLRMDLIGVFVGGLLYQATSVVGFNEIALTPSLSSASIPLSVVKS